MSPLPALRYRHTLKYTTGFTLMEVLVAMLILALGAGGVISMQINALRVARESAWQASAVQFAAELAELIYVTPAIQYPAALTTSASASVSSPLNSIINCHQQACGASAMTGFLITDWQQRLQQVLPQARVSICRDQAGDGDQLSWACSDQPQDSLFIKIGWVSHRQDAATPRLALAIASTD